MSDLAAQVSSRAWSCSLAISSYIQNGDFAGQLLRTVQANTLGTATEVALEKEAERKKEHQLMAKEPMEAPITFL